ncbi:putative mitochondrial-processing peptidase subunit beta [Auxenochlorella protothecoides]|uniref:mitochondrial processing peptidase n=1 Tax=Auxenochlorella protothecoides TaxID=3075 RepID=A0A087SBP3_AUXPR|nr:putative mitochondrial-processing peptidase subunit beta [Auxenochlorella protothecoides]KFM23147.1 putative mitochondrial-processing peptidase subunit beta [Auxenochlorella protothecoides]
MLRLIKRNSGLLQQLRGYAASSEAAVVESEVFTRYASPFPAQLNLTSALAQLPETKVSTLANGLRVASESVPFAETATVGVYIDAGSRFETDATNGAAHFLEHMAFKGTASRGVRDLEVEIENLGGHLNAYTSREQTAYYAKVFQKDVPQAVAILADILQNSKLEERAIARERDVILREQQEIEGIPEEVLFDHLHATAFQHSPLGRTILGPAENIRSLTRADLVDYITTNYRAPRIVVAAAGAVDHEALVAAVEKGFGKLPSDGPTASQLVDKEPALYTGSEVRIRDPDQANLHFALAYKGASWADPDSVPLMVIQTLLGAWEKNSGAGSEAASPLVQPLAVNGLANSFMAFNTNYHDTGLFGVYAVADNDADHEDLAWTILHKITGLTYGVSQTDVDRAKNQLKASILFSGDGTTGTWDLVRCSMAEDIGRNLLVYGRRIPKAELFARIDAVDAAAVKDVAYRFFNDQDVAVAALGDTQFLPDYTWLRRRTYWLRY